MGFFTKAKEQVPCTVEVSHRFEALHAHVRFNNGAVVHPGDAIGHGVDINEELAAKYPYQRAYLPVNRLEDGTLWHW